MEEKKILIKYRKVAIQRWEDNRFSIVLRDSEDNDVFVVDEHTGLAIGEEYVVNFGYDGVIVAMTYE